ncbi:MAG: hypothetical protein PWR20_16 [Bacteroidales bacterium]|jgi:predicted DNA-binding transcriptional regulator YafY|nr:hypothetical protein [Bacteroidales bacterium]MDN5328591.1 hypothetical protein [Bacteroidales bacterium]
MPVNKNASYRYRVLDEIFRAHPQGVSFPDLLEMVSEKLSEDLGRDTPISERTLRGDINIMRSEPPRGYNAPIECRDGSYFYSDPEFSIYRMPFNQTDLGNLRKARTFLNGLKGLPFLNLLNQILEKYDINHILHHQEEYIQMDFSSNTSGVEYLLIILEALETKKCLLVDYKPFGSQVNPSVIVHPWLIKEFNSRWYLIGKSILHPGGVTTMGLDRMVKVEISNLPAEACENPLLLKKFEDIIGVSLPANKEPEEIILKFTNHRYKYIETKPLHKSQQRIGRDENFTTVSLKLIINKELISTIHYFGPDVEVIQPEYLKNQIKDSIKIMWNYYLKTEGES